MISQHGKGPALSHHQHMGGDARALKITSWLTGIYFVIELGIGIYTGSVAVLSDSFHTFSAVGGIVLALVASRIAARPADKREACSEDDRQPQRIRECRFGGGLKRQPLCGRK